jgi:4-amino-4-deoxy-L-arabinose transferase-like glycosyltransferase
MRYLKANAPALSIFCLALIVRIVYNVTVANDYTPTFDAGVYDQLAQYLLKAHCYCRAVGHPMTFRPPLYPTTFRPPLWPFIIATIYFFFGVHNADARFFYCVLDSGTCVLVYLLAKDLFGKRIALITGLIAAMYVGLFVWTGWLYTETLYTFCLTALIFSLIRLQQNMALPGFRKGRNPLNMFQSPWLWIASSGLFLGLTLLIRPTGSVLVGMLCLWAVLLVVGKVVPWRAVVKNTLVVLLIAIIVNAPWFYRNYLVTHSFFPISTVGTTLVGNYNDAVFAGHGVIRGMWLQPLDVPNPDFQDYTLADEQKDTARALDWMRTHMNEMPALLGLHALNMWTPYLYAHGLPFEQFPDRPASQVMFYLIPIESLPIFLLAVAGLLVTWKSKRRQFVLVYLVIALTMLQNIVFYGSPRYRAPIEPLLVLFVGGLLWWLMGSDVGTWRYARAKKELVQEDAIAIPIEFSVSCSVVPTISSNPVT